MPDARFGRLKKDIRKLLLRSTEAVSSPGSVLPSPTGAVVPGKAALTEPGRPVGVWRTMR